MSAKKVLIVRRLMLSVEARRETKIGELEVSTLVEQDVVRLDIANNGSVSGMTFGTLD
jgi:hypothetical protein